jgi:hypothetical protein
MDREIKTPLHPKPPLPVGTKVKYQGSVIYAHGLYTIVEVVDKDGLAAAGRSTDNYFIDHVGYELVPVGMERSYRNREFILHFVRRGSFTVVTDDDTEEIPVITKDVIDEFRDWFLDDPDFLHSVGTENIAKFAAIFDLAEKSVIREADSAA